MFRACRDKKKKLTTGHNKEKIVLSLLALYDYTCKNIVGTFLERHLVELSSIILAYPTVQLKAF